MKPRSMSGRLPTSITHTMLYTKEIYFGNSPKQTILISMIIAILGRQSRLVMAELEAVFGSQQLEPLGDSAALLEIEPTAITHEQLGGTIKVARLLSSLPTTSWQAVSGDIAEQLPSQLAALPEGKLTLGLSAYGLRVTPGQLQSTALTLKKIARCTGRPARVVPNKDVVLNSAQVLHNRLTQPFGMELLFVASGGTTYVAQTLSVQDVDSYSKRDFERPKRDAFVGMLPPKLAQIMINLAKPQPEAIILDPFCGTGVVLMEAALQGYAVAGSDLSQKMIDFTNENLRWLKEVYRITPNVQSLQQADATIYHWPSPIKTVVTETYLGQPLSGLPSKSKLDEIMQNCDTISRKFLVNVRSQLAPDARCCIAIPTWKVGKRFLHLPLVDDLKKMGYNRVSFSCANEADLIYHRPDQLVARELLVLTVRE